MFGSVSGLSNAAHTWLNTHRSAEAAIVASTPSAQGKINTSLPVQPAPAVREVISNDTRFSIESLLDQHASDSVGMATRMRIQYPKQPEALELEDAKSAQEVFEDAECKTCSERKYQDGSNDPGVSFKTASHLSPEQAATAVRSHEMEHVNRNRAKAQREDQEIVSQSVTIHTDICPECGRVYTSGGTTRTITRGNSDNNTQKNSQKPSFSAVA